MRMFAVFLFAVAIAAGASLFATEPREASAQAQVLRGPGCAVFGHPPSAAGVPVGDFATNIVGSDFSEYISVLEPTDQAFGGLVADGETGIGQIVFTQGSPFGPANVHCEFDVEAMGRLIQAPSKAIVIPFTCGGPGTNPSTHGQAKLTPSGRLNVHCHWSDSLLPT